MTQAVRVKGDKAIIRKLSRLKGSVARRILRASMPKALKPMKDKAKANAKKIERTKQLWKSIGIKVSTNRSKGTTVGKVGPRQGFRGHRYAHLVHQGTQSHNITVRTAPSLQIDGEPVGQTVQHPGSQPNPFLAEAFDSKSAESQRILASEIRRRIQKEAKR